MADVLGKKISELAETTDLAGLYTIGSDRNNQSKKVPLQFVKEAADYANAQGDYAKSVGDTVQGNTGVDEYPVFSASTQYAAGSVVRYNDKLYRFTALHPAGSWVGTDAVETSIKAETESKLTELESSVALNVALFNKYNEPVALSEINVDNGIYIDYAGRAFTGAEYAVTDYQYVRGLKTIRYNGLINDIEVVAYVAFFDKNKQFLSSLLTDTTNQISVDAEVPENAYYARFSCYKRASRFLVEIPSESIGNVLMSVSDTQEELASYKKENTSKITDLESSVALNVALFNKYNEPVALSEINVDNGIYIDYAGRAFTNAEYAVTDYQYVRGLKTIRYNGLINDISVVAYAAFFDKNKQFLSSLLTDTTNQISVNVEVPENAYYARFSCYKRASKFSVEIPAESSGIIMNSIGNTQLKTISTETRLTDLESMVALNTILFDKNNQSVTLSEITIGNGVYIDFAGRAFTNAEYGVTDYQYVRGLKTIRYNGLINDVKVVAYVAFFDDNKQFLSSLLTDTTNQISVDAEVPENAYYARFSCHKRASKFSVEIPAESSGVIMNSIGKTQLETIQPDLNNIDYISKYGFTYFFNKCICIGDSVTHGHVYDYPRTPANGKVITDKSYPAYLAKMTGWEITNAGKAGITSAGWWTSMFPNYTYTDYELAIIELGYNQGLTDTLDVDVEPYVGYENYAETNTGCYCKIIEAIKEANPNILIVLVISSNFNDVNESVVRQIANRYGLPLINLKDKTYMNLSDSKYHGYIGENTGKDYVHFNFIGYLAKAKFIFNSLNYIIDYNAAMVNDLQPKV